MLTLADAWLHTIDPYLIWPIRWYGLSYLVGFLLGYLLLRLVTTRGRSPLKTEQAGDLVVTLAICGVIGGRLGYVLFYKRALIWQVTDHVPYWGVLAINDGGMSIHGGVIGAVLGCLLYAYRHRQNAFFLGDLLAFGAPPGLALGRVANFINGELIGRGCHPDFPLAVKFPTAMRLWPEYAPEKASELVRTARQQGQALLGDNPRQMIEYAIMRIQEGDAAMAQMVRPMLEPRHPSQLYAALGEGVLVGLVLLWLYRKPRRPGVVGFSFLIAYGIARTIDEFWRKPDAHIDFDAVILGWQVTRGQWLSLAMLMIGVIGVAITARRPVEKLGGWLRADPAR
jgi:phosphatidylglycerol:prolipoprotein diacylglycerol transferase